jgi:two-component system, OmpR family, sensor histidine kinase YxdK
MKERDIFRMFMKRVVLDVLFYFTALILVTVFYQLSSKKQVEILYPYSIAVTVLLIWLGLKYTNYRNFYGNLHKMERNCGYDGRFGKEDEKLINQTFNQVHREYLQDIRNMELQQEEQRRFLSAWIHNMKTPVTVENLIVQRVERGELDEKAAIEEVKFENIRLFNNLDMLLNMIRLQEFAKDYVPEELDLAEEINQIINNNKRLFIYSNVFPKVINECEGKENTKVLSDRKWNRHMLEQVISNAVKYSKEEGVAKNVTFRIVKEEKKTVLYVKDEGIGIEETDLPRVFEPFFTGENGRDERSSSGIGLYFCKEISEHIQCEISIESKISEGTTVKVVYLNSPSNLLNSLDI